MALSHDAQRIYEYLAKERVTMGKVATYGEVHAATGVAIGEGGGYMGKILGEIFRACDDQQLPSLTSIVVRAGEGQVELYDRTRRHGMPGPGYFSEEAGSPNRTGRRRESGYEKWKKPMAVDFDKDAERWRFVSMIEAHQESVWARKTWPDSL